jgi:putative tryptophan/tyrosine transport system substrate-binding protein
MGRRELVTLIGGATITWPLAARAQPPGETPPRVGLLLASPVASSESLIEAFKQGLKDQRLQPDRDIVLLLRGPRPDGNVERAAAELANDGAAILVGASVREVRALTRAAPDKPVVMVAVGDPVGVGLVASLERPGGNVTGLSDYRPDFSDQRLRLLQELLPGLRAVGFIYNPEAPTARRTFEAAERLHIRILPMRARASSEIAVALSADASESMDALLVAPYPASYEARREIGRWAAARGLPVLFGYADFMDLPAEVAGLASLGSNLTELYRRAADYVAQILRGARPGDLSVGQPQQGQLIVNLAVARRLQIEVSATILQRADAIIR